MAFPAHLPTPRTPDPLAAPILRWGTLGPGWITDRWDITKSYPTRRPWSAIPRSMPSMSRHRTINTFGSFTGRSPCQAFSRVCSVNGIAMGPGSVSMWPT